MKNIQVKSLINKSKVKKSGCSLKKEIFIFITSFIISIIISIIFIINIKNVKFDFLNNANKGYLSVIDKINYETDCQISGYNNIIMEDLKNNKQNFVYLYKKCKAKDLKRINKTFDVIKKNIYGNRMYKFIGKDLRKDLKGDKQEKEDEIVIAYKIYNKVLDLKRFTIKLKQ